MAMLARIIRAPALGCVLLLATASCRDASPALEGEWARVGPGQVERALVEVGDVVSEQVTIVRAPSGGEVIWLIDEGTQVEKDAVLARFNSEDIEETLANQEREVEAARQALLREQESLRSKRAEMQLETRKTELEVRAAELSLESLLKESTEELIARGEVTLERAAFEAAEAQRAVERVRRLLRAGVASGQELIAAEEVLTARKIEQRKASRTLKAVKEGPDPRLVAESQLKVEQACKNRDRQRETEKESVALFSSRVEIARANLDKALRSLEYNRGELANCTVRAPIEGRVVFHRVWKGDDNQSRIEVGESLNRNSEVLKLADLDNLRLRFPVNEVDLQQVRSGMRSEVRLIGIAGKVFTGEVCRLGDVAWDKNKRLGEVALMHAGEAGVAVVEVEVTLRERDPRIRLGFTGRVRILLDPVAAPLVVPASAVFVTSAGPAVRVRGESKPRVVKLGPGWGEQLAVIEGLEIGEEVLIGR